MSRIYRESYSPVLMNDLNWVNDFYWCKRKNSFFFMDFSVITLKRMSCHCYLIGPMWKLVISSTIWISSWRRFTWRQRSKKSSNDKKASKQLHKLSFFERSQSYSEMVQEHEVGLEGVITIETLLDHFSAEMKFCSRSA